MPVRHLEAVLRQHVKQAPQRRRHRQRAVARAILVAGRAVAGSEVLVTGDLVMHPHVLGGF